jgi:hypothetical protein
MVCDDLVVLHKGKVSSCLSYALLNIEEQKLPNYPYTDKRNIPLATRKAIAAIVQAFE